MGRNRPQSVIVPGRHVTWYGNDTQRMRAVYIINALLGAVGRPGGLYFNKPPFLDEYPASALRRHRRGGWLSKRTRRGGGRAASRTHRKIPS